MYKVRISKGAEKQLRKLDKSVRQLILSWIRKNLENCEDPRAKGKGLTSNRSGQWRYRVGEYRIICDIRDEELIILALSIGHRKNIY